MNPSSFLPEKLIRGGIIHPVTMTPANGEQEYRPCQHLLPCACGLGSHILVNADALTYLDACVDADACTDVLLDVCIDAYACIDADVCIDTLEMSALTLMRIPYYFCYSLYSHPASSRSVALRLFKGHFAALHSLMMWESQHTLAHFCSG